MLKTVEDAQPQLVAPRLEAGRVPDTQQGPIHRLRSLVGDRRPGARIVALANFERVARKIVDVGRADDLDRLADGHLAAG